MDVHPAILGLLALGAAVAIPVLVIRRIARAPRQPRREVAGEARRTGARARPPRRARTLCFDCQAYAPVVARPSLHRPLERAGPAPWRVPLGLELPVGLSGFLDEHEEWIRGLLEKHTLLFGEQGPDWTDFTGFLNRQLEREGLRTGLLFPRPLRLSEELACQLVYRHQLATLWATMGGWVDDFAREHGRDWFEELPAALVEEFGDEWESLLPYVEWYGITQGLRLPTKRLRRAALELHLERLDRQRSSELAAHAQGLAVTIEEVDAMDPFAFEGFLGELFESLGYAATPTPPSGDQGADVLLEKGGERTVIQAKRYSQPVGIKAVQEVIAAREYFGCHRARVVTNSTFTRAARRLAASTEVNLVGREGLTALLEAYNAARV